MNELRKAIQEQFFAGRRRVYKILVTTDYRSQLVAEANSYGVAGIDYEKLQDLQFMGIPVEVDDSVNQFELVLASI